MVSGFRFRVFGFRFRVFGFRFRVFGFRRSGLQAAILGRRVLIAAWRPLLRNDEPTNQRTNETTNQRTNETTKRRNDEPTKRRNDETTKQRTNETTKRRNYETTKLRNYETMKKAARGPPFLLFEPVGEDAGSGGGLVAVVGRVGVRRVGGCGDGGAAGHRFVRPAVGQLGLDDEFGLTGCGQVDAFIQVAAAACRAGGAAGGGAGPGDVGETGIERGRDRGAGDVQRAEVFGGDAIFEGLAEAGELLD